MNLREPNGEDDRQLHKRWVYRANDEYDGCRFFVQVRHTMPYVDFKMTFTFAGPFSKPSFSFPFPRGPYIMYVNPKVPYTGVP